MILGAGVFLVGLNLRLGAGVAPARAWHRAAHARNFLVDPAEKPEKPLETLGGMSSEVQESLDNFKVIVAFNRIDYFRAKFQAANDRNFAASSSAGFANGVFLPLYGPLSSQLAQLIVVGLRESISSAPVWSLSVC